MSFTLILLAIIWPPSVNLKQMLQHHFTEGVLQVVSFRESVDLNCVLVDPLVRNIHSQTQKKGDNRWEDADAIVIR